MHAGIKNQGDEPMRIHLEPFVPSDPRSMVVYDEWASTMGDGSNPQLVCISIDSAALVDNGVTVGYGGRYFIGSSTIISPRHFERLDVQ